MFDAMRNMQLDSLTMGIALTTKTETEVVTTYNLTPLGGVLALGLLFVACLWMLLSFFLMLIVTRILNFVLTCLQAHLITHPIVTQLVGAANSWVVAVLGYGFLAASAGRQAGKAGKNWKL
ncbi:hypothetical protein F4780DRAFT_781888 [Xylariomycetidae sp. FL0641]|nr:hypothetical protein F4780DRAFT_781888 [Xylariomycetidae sp. FL0641]